MPSPALPPPMTTLPPKPTDPSPAVLGYAAARPAVEWREADGVLVLLVAPPAAWRRATVAGLVLAWQLLMVVIVLGGMALSSPNAPRASLLTLGAACAVACVARAAVRAARAGRSGDRPGIVRVDERSFEVAPPGERPTRWPRAGVVGLRCTLGGVARGVVEHLRLDVDLAGGRSASASLPWPAEAAADEVEPRLKAALDLAPAAPPVENP